MACTYMLQCSDDSLYTGYTTDLQHRVMVHSQGKASKCTRAKLPVKLVYFEEWESKEAAMSREWHIKQLTRDEKLKLIKNASS